MRVFALISSILALLAAPLPAQAPAHDTLTVASRSLNESRLINVHLPAAYARQPSARFAVLYMPDGGIDEDFPHVVKTIDSLVDLGRIPPMLVVGIPNTERRRDLTGPTRFKDDSAIAPRVGGSAAFRAFIRDELIPVIEKRYRVTDERAIVGESLAGLFVLETLLATPELFDRYIALDPSVWWNGGALVDSAGPRLPAAGAARRTLVLATSNVKEIADGVSKFERMMRRATPWQLTWTYLRRPDLTHATIFLGVGPEALATALR